MALFRHVLSGQTPGEVWSFTLHTEGNLSAGDANDALAAAITAAYTNGFATITPPEVTTTAASTATINEATDGQVTRVEVVLALAGTAAEEMLPYQCATCITLVTASATRHGRGRFYLPPLAAGVLDAGRLSAAAVSNLDVSFTAFFDQLATSGLTVVVRNRTGHISTPVTEARVGDVIDTQRRRRNKLDETFVAVPV
jgi:sulfite reductase beta subunit-like hemoprotein